MVMYTLSNAPSGVYRISDMSTRSLLAARARAERFEWFHASGKQVRSKKRFLTALAKTLGLPRWFGMNWDALADSLTDFEWQPNTTHILLLSDFDCFAAHAPVEFATAVAVLEDAAAFWAERDVRLLVLVESSLRCRARMPTLYLR
jgi:uncharacterized protein YbjT (DUF2867 family)